MILARWYVHVSGFTLLRVCIISAVSAIALHLFIHRTHSCALPIHALHSLMRCTNFSLFIYQLCMCYICSCVVLASHSFTRRAHSCVALIHASHLFMRRTDSCIAHSFMRHLYLCVELIYASHLFIRCTHFMHHTHSTIYLSMRQISPLIFAPDFSFFLILL